MSYSYIPQMNIADVDINIIHNDNDKYIIKKLPQKKMEREKCVVRLTIFNILGWENENKLRDTVYL